jgi:hypothetical protein
LELAVYLGRAIFVNGVSLQAAFLGSFVYWSAILLYILPTRTIFARWINSRNVGLLALGLFLGTWTVTGLSEVSGDVIKYYMFNWPEEVWVMLIPIMPMEYMFRSLVGTVIGTGVIAGMRAIGLVKPTEAIY